jgi:hypothetical protein
MRDKCFDGRHYLQVLCKLWERADTRFEVLPEVRRIMGSHSARTNLTVIRTAT